MQHSVDEFESKRNNHLRSITRKKVVRIVAIFLIWSLVVTYMFLPISKMQNMKVTGNVFLSDAKVIDIACIDSKTFRWDFDGSEAEKMLNNYKFGNYTIIGKSKIKNNLISVSIDIEEIFPLGVVGDDVLLSDGSTMTLSKWNSYVPRYYQDAVGHLPELNISMLSENSMDLFIKSAKKTSPGYIELRNKKEMLSISNVDVDASPEDEVYVYSFKEVKGGIVYVLNILLSPSRVSSKLTYEFYDSVVNDVINKANTSGIDSNLYNITIDYIGSWTIVDIE